MRGPAPAAPSIPLSLYVHLPWCEKKCPYCDFNSHQRASIPEDAYISALLHDLDAELQADGGARELVSVFIGGGTPSLFSVAAIARLLEGIRARAPLRPDAEITLEANPGSVEAQRLAGYAQAGVTRFSLGIQSFDDAALQRLGRLHQRRGAQAAIAAADAAGVRGYNLDLIMNTMAWLSEDVEALGLRAKTPLAQGAQEPVVIGDGLQAFLGVGLLVPELLLLVAAGLWYRQRSGTA